MPPKIHIYIMLTIEYISSEVEPVSHKMKCSEALIKMKEYNILLIPVIDDDEVFMGLLSKDILEKSNNSKIFKINPQYLTYKINFNQHILEAFELAYRNSSWIIPVVNDSNKFFGLITPKEFLTAFNSLPAVNFPGAILLIKLKSRDYSLVEISQIIESNNAKVLCLYINPVYNGQGIILTIKINTREVSSIVSSFERYEYDIKAIFSEEKELDDFYKKRADEFLNYMKY